MFSELGHSIATRLRSCLQHGPGKRPSFLWPSVFCPENGACNLTRVPCSLSKVTDLRFVFRNPGDDVNPKTLIIPLLRLTPWGPPVVPLPWPRKEAGRANSALLSSLMRSGEAKTGFCLKNRPKEPLRFPFIHLARL